MTKKEYMKKLAYQLRRLPKEDFDKAMDYFEEYFEDAGIENEQKAIEDLGAPEEAASALILDLAQENAVKPPKTMKRRFSALWIAILALFAAPIALPLALGILAGSPVPKAPCRLQPRSQPPSYALKPGYPGQIQKAL